MPFYTYRCTVCGKVFDELQGFNDPHEATHCRKACNRVFGIPQVSRDQLWNFKTEVGGKVIDVHSRKQYNAELKKCGLKQITRDDLKGLKPKDGKEQRKKQAKELFKKIHQKGGVNWVLGKENPKGPDKLKKEVTHG